MNHTKWLAVSVVLLHMCCSTIANEYSINIAIERKTDLLDVSTDLRIQLSRTTTGDLVQFMVTGCEYVVHQDLKNIDIEVNVNLPAKIHLTNSEAALGEIYNKSISYIFSDSGLILQNDETSANSVVGSVSDWLSMLVSPATNWSPSLAGIPITQGEYEVLTKAPPYNMLRQQISAIDADGVSVQKTSIINMETEEKGFSQINCLSVHGNASENVTATIMRNAFMQAVGDSFNEWDWNQ